MTHPGLYFYYNFRRHYYHFFVVIWLLRDKVHVHIKIQILWSFFYIFFILEDKVWDVISVVFALLIL